MSQRLKDLAQRVDFSEAVDDEGSEPAAKKAPQRWPWEMAHSKLKYGCTFVTFIQYNLNISMIMSLSINIIMSPPPKPHTHTPTLLSWSI